MQRLCVISDYRAKSKRLTSLAIFFAENISYMSWKCFERVRNYFITREFIVIEDPHVDSPILEVP